MTHSAVFAQRRVIGREIDFQGVARQVTEGRAKAVPVDLAHIVIAEFGRADAVRFVDRAEAPDVVREVAVPAAGGERYLAVEIVADGAAGKAAKSQGFVAAVCTLHDDFLVFPGLFGDQVDRAAHHIASEKRALGTAQYLDALEIEQVDVLPRGATDINLIDEHHHRLVTRGTVLVRTDAANIKLRLARIELAHGKSGRPLRNSLDIEDPLFAKVLSAERSDRKRHVLQVFGAPFSRDDDLFEIPLPPATRAKQSHGRTRIRASAP